jgi:hypothetical protein
VTDRPSRITDLCRQEALGRPDGHTQLEAAPMASQADVRRIALSLAETEEARDHFAFSVRNKGKLKGFVWVWMERVNPKKPRVPQPDVIAVRVASLEDKDSLVALDPAKFFTEPHYNGFRAVLVNLPAVTVGELKPLIAEAWRCQAPKDLDSKKKAASETRTQLVPCDPQITITLSIVRCDSRVTNVSSNRTPFQIDKMPRTEAFLDFAAASFGRTHRNGPATDHRRAFLSGSASAGRYE